MGIGCQTHPENNDDGQNEGIEHLIQEWKAKRCQFQNKCNRKRSQYPINCPFGCCLIPKQTHDKDSKYTRTDQPRILLNILEYLGHRTQLRCNQNSYDQRSEEHTSELQSRGHLVCRLLLEKKTQHDHS